MLGIQFSLKKKVNIFSLALEEKRLYSILHSLFSRASGRYFSLQNIPLPRADTMVTHGVRSAVIYEGSTLLDLIATRDKIRFITVKRDT